MSESSSAESVNPFVSELGEGREAFHAEVTEFALRSGERTPEDFLRHFSCLTIMRSLAARPMERARIVSQSTGVHEKVAHKMSPDASGEALQIALDESVTTSASIVRLFQADDKQRYLERHALWAFDIEGQPWKTTAAVKAAHDRAKSFVAYILERALENLLVSHEEMVHAITVIKLAQCLPKDKLGSIIQASLRTSEKFTEQDLLKAVPPHSLVDHLPLDYLWERVVVPLIAEAHDYAAKPVQLSAVKPAGFSVASNSDDGDWDRRSLTPVKEESDAPQSGNEDDPLADATVSDDEIVSEDEILDSDMHEDSSPQSAPGLRKGDQQAEGKKATSR